MSIRKCKIKKIVKILLIAFLVWGISGNFWGPCGKSAYWRYNPFTHTLTVTGSGEMYNYGVVATSVVRKLAPVPGRFVFSFWNSETDPNGPPWLHSGSEIYRVVINKEITSVGSGCFDSCDHLKKVYLPDSLKSVGAAAFQGCRRLKTIEIPSSVKIIGEFAFAKTGLRRLVVPKHTYIELEDSYKESYIGPVKIIRK
jgi:hypothetical protein